MNVSNRLRDGLLVDRVAIDGSQVDLRRPHSGWALLRVRPASAIGQPQLRVHAVTGERKVLITTSEHFTPAGVSRLIRLPSDTVALHLDAAEVAPVGTAWLLGRVPAAGAIVTRRLVAEAGDLSNTPGRVRRLFAVARSRGWRGLAAHLVASHDAQQVRHGRPEKRGQRDLEAARRAVQAERARALERMVASDRRVDLAASTDPELSVVVPVHNAPEHLLALLDFLETLEPAPEVVLVDDASGPETAELLARVDGARIERLARNAGFSAAVNRGMDTASAEQVLLLNTDAVPAEGAIDAAVRALHDEPDAAVVGSVLVAPDGLVEEAGCVLWSDGSTGPVGVGLDPEDERVGFRRRVDYASAASWLIRREAWRELGGFDADTFSPAYYEDVDWCLRAWDAGWAVVVEPAFRTHHYRHASASTRTSPGSLMNEHRLRLCERWSDTLVGLPSRASSSVDARVMARGERPLVMTVELAHPDPTKGGGLTRSYSVQRSLVALGATVTSVSSRPSPLPSREHRLHGVEYRTMASDAELVELLDARWDGLDVLVVCRPANMTRLAPHIARLRTTGGGAPLVVYDVEAVSGFNRLDENVDDQLDLGLISDVTLAVSDNDAALFAARHRNRPYRLDVLGFRIEEPSEVVGPRHRSGLLWVGPLHATGTSNTDAMEWFLDDVVPMLAAGERVDVVGRLGATSIATRFTANVAAHGQVDDVSPYYRRARAFIAPARFAVGLPNKVLDAAVNGLPSIITSVLADQLGWRDGHEALVVAAGDAVGFAAACTRLAEDDELWGRLSENGQRAARAMCAPAPFDRLVQSIVDDAVQRRSSASR